MTSVEERPEHQFDYLQESSVVVTPLVEEYAPALFKLIDANRDRLSQHGESTGSDYPTEEDALLSITNPEDPLRERYIVLSRGIVAGSINLTPVVPSTKIMTLGYWIGREFTRQGLASSAATMLSNQALTRPRTEEVIAFTHPENTYSQETLKNAGFTYLLTTYDNRFKFSKSRQ